MLRWTSAWEAAAFLLSAAGPLALYVLTLPRVVALEDDGLFLMTATHLGVSHPPGYPVHTLISHAFMRLPFGTPAVLGHLSSAVLGALACGALFACARRLRASRPVAVSAAWLLGASEHVWSQAIITEVYTLNLLLILTIYALLLRITADDGIREPATSPRLWFAAALLFGLGLANHWPLVVLSAPGFLILALPAWRRALAHYRPILAGFLPAAVLPYAWMVIRSRMDPEASFYGPLSTAGAIVHYVRRQGYSVLEQSQSAGLIDRLGFMGWFAGETVTQFTLPGLLVALAGLTLLLRRKRDAIAFSGLAVYVGNSVVLIMLLRFDFDSYWAGVFRPYPLASYAMVGLWLAVGLQGAVDLAAAKLGRRHRRMGALASALVLLGAAGMLAASVRTNWSLNDRSEDDFAERYAHMVFDLVPEDAVLVVLADGDTGPLGYYRYVEDFRPDVRLLNAQALLFRDRLYPWDLPRPEQDSTLRAFVRESERRVFFAYDPALHDLEAGIRQHGFLYEALRDSDETAMTIVPRAKTFFTELLSERPTVAANRRWRRFLLLNYGLFLGNVIRTRDETALSMLENELEIAKTDFFAGMGIMESLLESTDGALDGVAEEVGERAVQQMPDDLGRERRARFLYLLGFLRYRANDEAAALQRFRQSWAVYPYPDNAAGNAIRELGEFVW